MGRGKPWRATVYLPGHTEEGHGIAVGKIARTTQEALVEACAAWERDGYVVVKYRTEEPLPGMEA